MMPFYIHETKLSEKGLLNIKDIPSVLAQNIKGAEALGGKVVGAYYIFGEKSVVAIAEFPDDETSERWHLESPEDPNNEFWVLDYRDRKAFSLEEFTEIVNKLP